MWLYIDVLAGLHLYCSHATKSGFLTSWTIIIGMLFYFNCYPSKLFHHKCLFSFLVYHFHFKIFLCQVSDVFVEVKSKLVLTCDIDDLI